jgi:PE family
MDSMSHDPVAGDIGSQLVDIAMQGLDSGASVMMSLTALFPAGAEEVSAQAAMAFATEAAQMLASNTAAQQELMNTGMALTNIAKMYAQADNAAAGTLGFAGTAMSSHTFAGASGATTGAGLVRADALPGAAGSAARTPLMAGLIDKPVVPGTGGTAGTMPAVANAASSALGAGIAPLSSLGQGGAAAGGSRAGLASSFTEDQDDKNRDDSGNQQPGERLA